MSDEAKPPKPPAGVFLTVEQAQQLHDYLMERPCKETLGWVLLLRNAPAVARAPRQ
jgi:hypothetical protein